MGNAPGAGFGKGLPATVLPCESRERLCNLYALRRDDKPEIAQNRAAGKDFAWYWFNPENGQSSETHQIEGNETLQFIAPEMYPGTLNYSDWVLHVYQPEK